MQNVHWGLQPGPEDHVRPPIWGARAIYHEDSASFDLLHDRQDCSDGTDEERAALVAWLDTHGLPALRAAVARERPSAAGREIIEIRQDGFVLRASPRRSYGYLYVGAWRVAARRDADTP
jgi:hypothetical protein